MRFVIATKFNSIGLLVFCLPYLMKSQFFKICVESNLFDSCFAYQAIFTNINLSLKTMHLLIF